MELKPEQIESFKEIYRNKFGVELSDSEAYSKAQQLLQYVLLCIKPLPKDTEKTLID
jgi:hypothetical protein